MPCQQVHKQQYTASFYTNLTILFRDLSGSFSIYKFYLLCTVAKTLQMKQNEYSAAGRGAHRIVCCLDRCWRDVGSRRLASRITAVRRGESSAFQHAGKTEAGSPQPSPHPAPHWSARAPVRCCASLAAQALCYNRFVISVPRTGIACAFVSAPWQCLC